MAYGQPISVIYGCLSVVYNQLKEINKHGLYFLFPYLTSGHLTTYFPYENAKSHCWSLSCCTPMHVTRLVIGGHLSY